jgi:hypothetical protein
MGFSMGLAQHDFKVDMTISETPQNKSITRQTLK